MIAPKCIWLLRHAKSSWDDPELADHDRPLAPRGRRAGDRMARWFSENGVRPDLVRCSTALRAHGTLDLVHGELEAPPVELDARLYHASGGELLELLRATSEDVNDVMLIGHNPGLRDLACTLAPPGPEAFPTAALAELRFDERWRDLRAGCAILERLVLPRALS